MPGNGFYEDLNMTSVYDTTDDGYNNNMDMWEEMLQQMREDDMDQLIPLTVVLVILGVSGILGNCAVLCVYGHRHRRPANQVGIHLVVTLAVVDLLACATIIPGTLAQAWHLMFPSDAMCKLFELARGSLMPLSSLLLLALACERFLVICCSCQHCNITPRKLAMTICVLVVTGILFGIPYALVVGVYSLYGDNNYVYIGICVINNVEHYATFQTFLHIQTGMYALLIATVITCYGLIFRKVHKTEKACRRSFITDLLQPSMNLNSSSNKNTYIHQTGIQSNETNVNPDTKDTAKTHSPNVSVVEGNNFSCIENEKNDDFSPTRKKSSLFLCNSHLPGAEICPNSSDEVRDPIELSITTLYMASEQQPISSNKPCESKASSKPPSYKKVKHISFKSRVSPSNAWVPKRIPSPTNGVHLRMAKVMLVISLVFIMAYLPMYLMQYEVISFHMLGFYFYFLNNAANPFVYSLMNRRFRKALCEMMHKNYESCVPAGHKYCMFCSGLYCCVKH